MSRSFNVRLFEDIIDWCEDGARTFIDIAVHNFAPIKDADRLSPQIFIPSYLATREGKKLLEGLRADLKASVSNDLRPMFYVKPSKEEKAEIERQREENPPEPYAINVEYKYKGDALYHAGWDLGNYFERIYRPLRRKGDIAPVLDSYFKACDVDILVDAVYKTVGVDAIQMLERNGKESNEADVKKWLEDNMIVPIVWEGWQSCEDEMMDLIDEDRDHDDDDGDNDEFFDAFFDDDDDDEENMSIDQYIRVLMTNKDRREFFLEGIDEWIMADDVSSLDSLSETFKTRPDFFEVCYKEMSETARDYFLRDWELKRIVDNGFIM